MDECHLTRRYLESLTTRELAVLADNAGIDIPPGLDRIFIIEEILEAEKDDENDSEDGEEAPLEETEFLDPVPLPGQYNITYIKALIRDPLWVFVFWEIKSHDKEFYEKAQDFEGYFLKVSSTTGEYSGYPPLWKGSKPAPPSQRKPVPGVSFTVPVGPDDTAWYLGFSPDYSGKDAAGGGWFQVELCARQGTEQQTVLAASQPFRLPAILQPAGAKTPRSPLAGLSAMDELSVLRNGDRRPRISRGRQ